MIYLITWLIGIPIAFTTIILVYRYRWVKPDPDRILVVFFGSILWPAFALVPLVFFIVKAGLFVERVTMPIERRNVVSDKRYYPNDKAWRAALDQRNEDLKS